METHTAKVRRIAIACALGAALLTGIAAQGAELPQASTSADRGAEVRRLFTAAQAAFAKQDYEAAYKAYLAAWSLQKSYDIAGNLANVEIKLGKVRDAAEHVDFALRNFPPTGDPKQREALRARSVMLMSVVARVRVRVSVDGAAVMVNGMAVGSSPVDTEVFIPPGEVIVEARREGFTEGRAVLEVHGGSRRVGGSRGPNSQGGDRDAGAGRGAVAGHDGTAEVVAAAAGGAAAGGATAVADRDRGRGGDRRAGRRRGANGRGERRGQRCDRAAEGTGGVVGLLGRIREQRIVHGAAGRVGDKGCVEQRCGGGVRDRRDAGGRDGGLRGVGAVARSIGERCSGGACGGAACRWGGGGGEMVMRSGSWTAWLGER